MKRASVVALMTLYCTALWVLFDFGYSSLFAEHARLPRIASPLFHHTLATEFDGFDVWAEHSYRLYTDNLGFKDASVREVPLVSSNHRIVLIGDSFTEGIGLPFEDTFAGMLYAAGQKHSPKIEFLNAAVASYSPTLYYKKIKYLINKGLKFDELVVLPDMSDVLDEASRYFCVDDIPKYKVHCKPEDAFHVDKFEFSINRFFQKRFVVTDAVRMRIKIMLSNWRHPRSNPRLTHSPLDAWAMPGWNPGIYGKPFAPLGIEGGIARSLEHMQNLADLTKAHGIKMTVAVYPYGAQIASGQRNSRQIDIYREFCNRNSIRFINLFPNFFSAADTHSDWPTRYFLLHDFHYNAEGNRIIFEGLAKFLL